MLLVHIAVRPIDQDPDPEITPTETGLQRSLDAVAVTISTEKVRGQALTDPGARQEGIIDAHPHKKGLGGESYSDRAQEVLIATQASPTTELLRHRDEILLRQCSVSGA